MRLRTIIALFVSRRTVYAAFPMTTISAPKPLRSRHFNLRHVYDRRVRSRGDATITTLTLGSDRPSSFQQRYAPMISPRLVVRGAPQ